jgi:hypothetical protein
MVMSCTGERIGSPAHYISEPVLRQYINSIAHQLDLERIEEAFDLLSPLELYTNSTSELLQDLADFADEMHDIVQSIARALLAGGKRGRKNSMALPDNIAVAVELMEGVGGVDENGEGANGLSCMLDELQQTEVNAHDAVLLLAQSHSLDVYGKCWLSLTHSTLFVLLDIWPADGGRGMG